MTKAELQEKYDALEKDHEKLKREHGKLEERFNSYHKSLTEVKNERDKFRREANEEKKSREKFEMRMENEKKNESSYKTAYEELVKINKRLNSFLQSYRNVFTSFMQGIQGTLANAVELDALYSDMLKGKGDGNNG